MKTILPLLIILLTISCKSQNIVPYDSDQDIFTPNSGNYYKDTNNDFNIYEGEWKWENTINNSELIFIFEKEENISSSAGYTKDLLIGEYKFIENGVELANTLLYPNGSNTSGRDHKISGMNIMTKYVRPRCDECAENEKRVQTTIVHDNYDGVYANLVLRHFIENGIEKIKAIIYDGAWLSSDPDAPEDIDIPFGEYILIKQ